MTTTTNLDVITTQLQSRLDVLLRRVGMIAGDLRTLRDDDATEQATERENDAVLERLDDLSRHEVGQIRRALQRIVEGHYGICAVCGRAIDRVRLDAVPTAVTCVGCEKSDETA